MVLGTFRLAKHLLTFLIDSKVELVLHANQRRPDGGNRKLDLIRPSSCTGTECCHHGGRIVALYQRSLDLQSLLGITRWVRISGQTLTQFKEVRLCKAFRKPSPNRFHALLEFLPRLNAIVPIDRDDWLVLHNDFKAQLVLHTLHRRFDGRNPKYNRTALFGMGIPDVKDHDGLERRVGLFQCHLDVN